jgi:hypothetical protein
MCTTAQLTANRANAEHSTGPKTDEGKAIVARNHITHGLSIRRHIVLPGEDHDEYEALLSRYKEEQMPGCAIERSLITLLAECEWRNQRCNRIQYGMIEESGLTIEAFYEQNEAKLQRFERYAGQHRRDYSRILRDYLSARSARRKDAKDGLFTGPTFPDFERESLPQGEMQNEANPSARQTGTDSHDPSILPLSTTEQPDSGMPACPRLPADTSKPISARIPYSYANELVGLKRLHPDFNPQTSKKLMSMSLRDYLKHPGNLYAAQKLMEVA